MKTTIHSYPQFEEALKNNEIVYLFGTGISSALTNQRYSWWKWITDGIHFLKDKTQAGTLEKELNDDGSTKNMIAVAGKVLRAAKADGVYETWMQSSFETNPIRDRKLAVTLRKLLITQDVFATTNYDLLLEQATGLGTLSYMEPDMAFSMLDQKLSTHVLHIHGVYDSAHGIDNIVADEDQYGRVLDDKGAQFIQNILGTRTLVFVGCGKTTEDANIARFIQFAKDWLKLDRPYYFLHNSKETFDGMPGNVVMVPYGDEYSDLPAFLEDMAQIRLRARIESNPIIDRTLYTGRRADSYGLSEYHFANEYLRFCGRNVELAQLENFAETDVRICWWAVTGQAGAGKSRLAYELLRRLENSYFAFFLNTGVDVSYADRFQPFNDTFIIIDYIKGNEKRTAEFVVHLMDKFRPTGYRLRLLFLERDNQLLAGSWYQLLESHIDVPHRARFLDAEYHQDIVTREHRFLYLDDLDNAAVVDLIGDICKKKGLPEDPHRDTALKKEYESKFEQLKFRPLFLQLYVEAWIDNGCIQVDYRNYEDLLRAVLGKEQERILTAVEDDAEAGASLLRLLVRAGVSDRLETDRLPKMYEQDWENVKRYNKQHSLPGIQRKERLRSLVGDAEQGLAPDTAVIAPLYPDIIKEAMFLYYVDEDDLGEIGEELWQNCPAEFTAFLSRALVDFADNEVLRGYIRQVTEDYSNTYAMEARFALLQNEVVRTVEEGPILLGIIREEYAYWNGMPVEASTPDEVRLIKLRGLNYSAVKYIGWSDPKGLGILEDISKFFDSDLITPYKISFLLDHAHYFTEKAVGQTSEKIIGWLSPVIERLPEGKEKTLCWLRLQREHMVNLIMSHKSDRAWKIHEDVCKVLVKTDEQIMELYAYICFSCAKETFSMLDYEQLLNYAFALQDMAEEYGEQEDQVAFNDKIHYYYLHAKFMQVEAISLLAALEGRSEYGIDVVDGLIEEIEDNLMIADFAGLLVGARALKIGLDEEVTDNEAKEYLDESESLLERYPDNEVLAAKALDLWETIYTTQFGCKVPDEVVKRAHALLLRFPKNADVQDGFHKLIENSAEADNRMEYYGTRQVMAGLIENHRTDYLDPPEREQVPYRRTQPKISPNDKCPCGSGKKFKKCCRGKGIYD